MKSNSTSKIAKSSFWLTASFAVDKLSQLISQIVLARLLSPEEFGVWAMVLIVTTLSVLFKDNAVASVLIQRGLDDQKRVNAVYSLGVNISIAMFGIQAIAAYPLSIFFGVPILFPLTVCVGLVFLIGAGTGTRGAILQRQMKFKEVSVRRAIAGVTRLIAAVVSAALGAGVWSFAIAMIVMELVNAILIRLVCDYPLKYSFKLDTEVFRDIRGFVAGMVGINLAVYANTNSDNFTIGKLLGATELGYYSVAYQLAMMPAFAISQINKVNFSVLSQRDSTGQELYVRKMVQLYAIFYSLLCGVAFIVAPWLIPTLYGANWVEAVVPFQIILGFAYARGFMAILGTALNAMNKPGINAAINWVLVPISIGAFLMGARSGGIVGVSIAVALVMGVGATIWFWIVTCRVAKWNLGALIKPVLLPTGMMAIAIAISMNLPILGTLKLFLQPMVLVLIYGAGLSLFSVGKIPRMLIDLAKRSLNSDRKVVSQN